MTKICCLLFNSLGKSLIFKEQKDHVLPCVRDNMLFWGYNDIKCHVVSAISGLYVKLYVTCKTKILLIHIMYYMLSVECFTSLFQNKCFMCSLNYCFLQLIGCDRTVCTIVQFKSIYIQFKKTKTKRVQTLLKTPFRIFPH